MKKIFTLSLIALATMFASNASAQTNTNIPAEDNDVAFLSLSTTNGPIEDITKVPFYLSLKNSLPITAIEAIVRVDGFTAEDYTNKFPYDADEEDYVYETNSERCLKSHNPVIGVNPATHDALGYYISITSAKSQNFKGDDGVIFSSTFDASGLPDGTYNIKLVDSFAVLNGDASTTSYYTADGTGVAFTIANGKATAVESITAEEAAKAEGIYTLDGKKVAEPVKGGIYVVNGKTVKY